MRGVDAKQSALFSYLLPEERIPKNHPLRPIRAMVSEALTQLDQELEGMYSRVGRPSIAPERLIRALLLQVLYSVRSERLLIEQLEYNLLFRWFVGMSVDEPVWDHSTFSKNRDRFLGADIARELFANIVEQARLAGLLSDEHFSVDGTMIPAWASAKSFRLGADKAYDVRSFIEGLCAAHVTLHVAQNIERAGGPAIDGRTTRHVGYSLSIKACKLLEEVFGWGVRMRNLLAPAFA